VRAAGLDYDSRRKRIGCAGPPSSTCRTSTWVPTTAPAPTTPASPPSTRTTDRA